MKQLIYCIALLFSVSGFAGQQTCLNVNATNLTNGNNWGSRIRVDNTACGNEGWICLDPESEHLTPERSRRIWEQALDYSSYGISFSVVIDNSVFPAACGNQIPVIQELRLK